jgi:hypothetical protein
VTKTDFKDLKLIQDELKPLHELWTVAYKFKKTIPSWIEGPFDNLDAIAMEIATEECLRVWAILRSTSL